MITVEDLRNDPRIKGLIERSRSNLVKLGYTEHGFRHVERVSRDAGMILKALGYPKRDVRLAELAGYMHDMGAAVNRVQHEQTGAIIAMQVLEEMGVPFDEILDVITAIGNHHEETGEPVTAITAALILADKIDVDRSRVVASDLAHDIHDRVNFAASSGRVEVDPEQRIITYHIETTTEISPVIEYFEIFTARMIIARKAANALGCSFQLWINNTRML